MSIQARFTAGFMAMLAADVVIFSGAAAQAQEEPPAPSEYRARVTTTHDSREEAPGVYSIRTEGSTGSRYIFYTAPEPDGVTRGREFDALMCEAGTPDDPRDDYITGLRTMEAARAGNAYDRGRAEH